MENSKIVVSNKLEKEINTFSKDQLQVIYQNLYLIELTKGCSRGCDFCLANAPYGVSDIIPKSTVERIAEEYAGVLFSSQKSMVSTRGGCLELYHASDPLDYEYSAFNYFDILEVFTDRGFSITTSTAIPAGKEELAIQNLEKIDQISISHMNRNRLMPYFEKLGIAVYLDMGNYYIFRGVPLSRGPITYAIKVEGTVEETLEGLRKSDLSLPKKARFYDIRTDTNRPRDEIQGESLFLFCGDSDLSKSKVSDRDYSTVMPVGRAFDREAYRSEAIPFGWFNGVKITPEGFFNVFSTKPTRENTTGQIIEKITANDFKVIKLEETPQIRRPQDIRNHYIVI
ncbi:Uncharacterised protein [uncultured archaeon]|nr:Uncharacterised protein [uncultured archaeon]